MTKSDYSKDILKQLHEVMAKCDNLSLEIKKQKREYEIRIEKLEIENKELKEKNEKLSNEVARLKKIINNDSNNSSNPPSTDIKKNIPNNREKTNKKIGAQNGHKAHFLSKKAVEEKIKTGEYKHKIIHQGKVQKEYKSKYILDIKVDVEALEYRFYPNEDGKYNIPTEFQTDVQYGSEIKTLCTVLNTEGVVAIDRLANFVSCISHGAIKISNGSIVNFMKDFNKKSNYIIEQIKTDILNSEIMHTDATTARCDNKNICVRTHSTEGCTLLVPTYGKGKKYIEETNILNRYAGHLVHDHETVMYNYGNKHIECNVHISRYLKGCYENTKNMWALKMRSFLCSLNEYRKKVKSKGENRIDIDALERYSKRYDDILATGYEQNKKVRSKYLRQEEQKLLNRLKKYKENHLMFLYDFSAPFDNNLAERDLRHMKTKQKISGCFNSIEGIKIYANIKSIISTLKKRGKNFYISISNVYKNIPVSI